MHQSILTNILRNAPVTSAGEEYVVADRTTSSISHGFAELAKHRIHSLPVHDGNTWVAFLDLSDVVRHLFSCFSDEDLKHVQKIMEFKGEYLRVLEPKQRLWEVDHSAIPDPQKIQYFQSKTVGEIARHQYFPVSEDKSLMDIVNVLVEMPKLRRIPIVSGNQLKRIVTPMDIVKLLVSKDLGPTGQLKVSDVNLHQGKAEIVKISKDATALEGFRLLETKNITGVAVVDDQNKVVGSLSISDLKAIMYDASEFINLHLPVSDFIRKVRQRDSLTPQGDISVTSQSTLSEVLNCFAKYQVHRVFIVDDAHSLKGIITLGDLLVALKNYSL